MTYRDEGEALRARVAQLEGDLASAQETVAKLEGRTPVNGSTATETITHSRLLGSATGITLDRLLPFAITDEGYEAIAAAVQQRLGVQVSQVGRTLTAGQFLTVAREGEQTRVRLTADWTTLRAMPPSAAALAGGFTALATISVLHDFAIGAPAMIGVHAAWVGLASAISAGWFARSRAHRRAANNLELYRGLFETALRLGEEHAVAAAHPRVRVGDAHSGAEPLEVEVDQALPAKGNTLGN